MINQFLGADRRSTASTDSGAGKIPTMRLSGIARYKYKLPDANSIIKTTELREIEKLTSAHVHGQWQKTSTRVFPWAKRN